MLHKTIIMMTSLSSSYDNDVINIVVTVLSRHIMMMKMFTVVIIMTMTMMIMTIVKFMMIMARWQGTVTPYKDRVIIFVMGVVVMSYLQADDDDHHHCDHERCRRI